MKNSNKNGAAKRSSNGSAAGKSSARTASSTAEKTKSKSAAQEDEEEDNDGEESGGKNDEMLAKYFEDLLKDIYWAEKQLVKELPKLAKEANSEELSEAFLTHRDETEGQITRLEEVFEILGKKAQAKKCAAMEGLMEEAREAIEETEDGSYTRDVALIVTAQKVEHYEIAAYGSLAQIARTLGHEDAAELLDETLTEEKNCDELLTQLAESGINQEAAGEEENEAAE